MPVTYTDQLSYAASRDEAAALPRHAFGLSGGAVVDFPDQAVTIRGGGPGVSASQLLDGYVAMYQLQTIGSSAAQRLRSTVVAQNRPDWQRNFETQLEAAMARLHDDRPIPAGYAFVAAMDEADVASFMSRARRILRNPATTRRQWERFLTTEARAHARPAHVALPPLESAESAEHDVAHVPAGLISLTELRSRVHRGALRGHRALADAADG
jgi:hypothetical protein